MEQRHAHQFYSPVGKEGSAVTNPYPRECERPPSEWQRRLGEVLDGLSE